ncbi:MAG: hypothetical protein ACJ797_16410 [Ktedonobacteraceae bacterium]
MRPPVVLWEAQSGCCGQRNATLRQWFAQWSHRCCHRIVGPGSKSFERIAFQKETLWKIKFIHAGHGSPPYSFPVKLF